MDTREEPLLGLATTRELLAELSSRMGETHLGWRCREALKDLAPTVLDYRTVD